MNDEIDVPDSVLIRCPKVEFKLARVAKCSECAEFTGLADRFPGSEAPFARRYLVLCRHEPTKRELQELAP